MTEPKPATCLWTEDEDGVWNTACSESWILETGKPRDNNMRFCPFCGNPLRQRSYREGRR